jgi:hypothetical protein
VLFLQVLDLYGSKSLVLKAVNTRNAFVFVIFLLAHNHLAGKFFGPCGHRFDIAV